MGEFSTYINDVQGPDDIPKLFGKFGERRAIKIANGLNNFGKSHDSIVNSSHKWKSKNAPISKLTFLFLGGILNYVSQKMFNAVSFLTTNRPLNLTFYCRHDIQVYCTQKEIVQKVFEARFKFKEYRDR